MELTTEHIQELTGTVKGLKMYSAALRACLSANNKHWAQLLRRFTAYFADRHPEYAHDFEPASVVVIDTLQHSFYDFAVQEVMIARQISTVCAELEFKRRFIESWVDKSSQMSEVFSAYVATQDPDWFREERFDCLHQGVSNWDATLAQFCKDFEPIEAVLLRSK